MRIGCLWAVRLGTCQKSTAEEIDVIAESGKADILRHLNEFDSCCKPFKILEMNLPWRITFIASVQHARSHISNESSR